MTNPLGLTLRDYDLVVLGSGPGGKSAAIQAAKLGKRVLVVEREKMGGACLHRGTIPSKALRESALALGEGSSLQAVMARTKRIIEEERLIIEEYLDRNQIEFASGTGSFIDRHHVRIDGPAVCITARAKQVVVAVGTRPRRPPELNFDGVTLFDSDTILEMTTHPRTLLVIGAGVIGCEYASIFARMGTKVTLIESRPELLKSMDREVVAALMQQFEKAGISLLLATDFANLQRIEGADGRPRVSVELHGDGSRQTRTFDAALYCLGRVGNHENLNLSAVGLNVDERGLLTVNKNYRTKVDNIYAVGDIIGSPALAASSAEQGRLASLCAFTGKPVEFPETFPYGIYTIPEISSVGAQEHQLAARGVKYVVGRARYAELSRGKMMSDDFGFLKLLVHASTRRIIGIHVIGQGATELVHIGQVAMAFGGTVDFLIENVFNYPTLAEAYKVAAYNANSRLKELA
jgi:NAD(P) transhydrogenase